MEISMTTGTRCFPQFGSVAVPGQVWLKQVGMQVAVSAAAGSLRTAAFAGRPVYRARLSTLSNPTGIDLPVNHRLRTSASEP